MLKVVDWNDPKVVKQEMEELQKIKELIAAEVYDRTFAGKDDKDDIGEKT